MKPEPPVTRARRPLRSEVLMTPGRGFAYVDPETLGGGCQTWRSRPAVAGVRLRPDRLALTSARRRIADGARRGGHRPGALPGAEGPTATLAAPCPSRS